MPEPLAPDQAGTLAQLIRYPVKSVLGEQLFRVRVELRGLEADRLWSVHDSTGRLGSGKSSSRFVRMEGLLHLRGTLPEGDPVPTITWPDGRALRTDDPGIAAALGQTVQMEVDVSREGDASHHDDGPVHLVTTASLRWLEQQHGEPAPVARFRPNLVLDTADQLGPVEQDWVGRELVVGQVRLRVRAPMPRCVMTTMDQLDLPADRRMLHTLKQHAGLDLGVVADVLTPGVIAVGDRATLCR